jgi:pimeloyl-ACP methyl ester carboxylesterase
VNYCDIGSARIAYEIYGNGGKTLVIDACLGSCSAEWWHIAEALSNNCKILVYDRAGYGGSSVSTLERTPRNVAVELNKLLSALGIDKEVIIMGHSQGGLYAVEYAIMYPGNVKGLILLDPATPYDNEFKEKLTADEYKRSGVDKTVTFRSGLIIASLGLGFAFRPLFKKAIPFYYYKFSDSAEEYLLKSYCKKNRYKTALAEYKSVQDGKDTTDIEKAVINSSLKNIPVKLITHSSDFYIKELEYFGNMDGNTARKIEYLWQDIMKRYLSLSGDAEHIIAPNSGHFIHLTDFDVLRDTVEKVLQL